MLSEISIDYILKIGITHAHHEAILSNSGIGNDDSGDPTGFVSSNAHQRLGRCDIHQDTFEIGGRQTRAIGNDDIVIDFERMSVAKPITVPPVTGQVNS